MRIMALLQLLKDAPDSSLLVPKLEQLHTLLVNHFAHEQFPGGLYETMGAFGSAWHDDLRELIRDHCLILSAARGTLERARTSTPHTQHTLRADVLALVEQLYEHEQKEHALARRLQADSANERG
jgi:hypothetical protein